MPRKNNKTNKNKQAMPLYLAPRMFGHRSLRGGNCNSCMMRGGKRKRKTIKQRGSLPNFYRTITLKFLEMLNTVKLYHWKTYSYATHKATDELYSKLNENVDHFIEVLLGKTGQRIDLSNVKTLSLKDYTSVEAFKREVDSYKKFLIDLDNNPALQSMSNTDLYNIRDELLGNLNQFLYLLTFTK